MNTNHIADVLLAKLTAIHSRSYRRKPPLNASYPYVVFTENISQDAVPGHDMMFFIQIYDTPEASVRAINDIADNIEEALMGAVVNDSVSAVRFERDNRQYVANSEFTKTQMIDLQYTARVYFK